MYKKIGILWIFVACNAMEYSITDQFNLLPQEHKLEIVSYLCDQNNIKSSLQDLITLSRVDKSFHQLIRQNKRYSIPALAAKLSITPRAICFYLHELGAVQKYKIDHFFPNPTLATQILQATKNNDIASVRKLLTQNADIDRGPFMSIAVKKNYTPIMKLFINAKVNVNSKSRGKTLLQIAAYRGYLEAVQLLIAAGAEINEQDKQGNTALMLAASKNRRDIVETLVKADANISITNSRYENAIDLSPDAQYSKLKEFLKNAKAQQIKQATSNPTQVFMMH